MSTIDPQQVSEDRRAAWRGSTRGALLLMCGAGLLFVGSALGGFAFGDFFDGFRSMRLTGSIGGFGGQSDLWLMPAATVTGLAGIALHFVAARLYTGEVLAFPVVGPATVGLFGAALGVWTGARSWTEPETVGTRTDAFDGEDKWGTLEWVLYRADTWLPLLVLVFAVLTLLFGFSSRARRRSRRALLEQLLGSGRYAEGQVTKIPTFESSSAAGIGNWTVKFTDAWGTDRWVTRIGRFVVSDMPRRDQAVTVLYDPSAPGDDKRIFVGPVGSKSVTDFVRWGL